MKAECEYLEGGKYVDLSWLTLKNATNSNPSECTTLQCGVLNLAIENYLIHSCVSYSHDPTGQQAQSTLPSDSKVGMSCICRKRERGQLVASMLISDGG
jgi:hypothetical protein